MEDDFDVNAAVDEIGSGLGFATEPDESGEVELGVTSPTDAGKETVTPADEPAATEPATSETTADAAPKTWRKEAAATWAALPSEAKNEILKRESDIFAGIESYKVDAGFGKSVKSVVAPYEQIMQANNMDPVKTIGGLLNAHHTLATGAPQVKLDLLLRMAKDYGIELPTPGAQTAAVDPPYVDPAVAALQSELAGVKSLLQTQSERAAAEQRNIVSKQIDAFAADPSNIYWTDLADDMAKMLESKQASTLKEAYDKAIWLNPTVRAKEIARQNAEATAKTQAEAAKVQETVKKATSVNVKARARSGSATTPLGTLDDTLASALVDIRSRA